MCGILGYFTKGHRQIERTVFEKAIDSLIHRGPDQRGIWNNGSVGLGFRRLSIIDLETGDQPMTNENGSLQIVFNGEIYNFKTLRRELQGKGHQFKTQSDTETILHLFEEHGERCVELLQGMFAFAIFDNRKNSLFLARDRFGKKPLVYSETSTGFYFGSEIGALLHLADCSREIDFEALDAYLALQYVPSPHTIWREMKRLPAASFLWVKNGIAETPQRYWRLKWTSSSQHRSPKEIEDQFRELFEESVKLRMIADVPLGAFLSGGIDSSVTVAAMTRVGAKVQTFCLGFTEARFDESSYAKEVAQALGTDHHEIRAEPDSLDNLDLLIENLGEPFADQSLLPTFLLSKFTRQHVTVALSGDGGDELFSGYKRYALLARANFLHRWKLTKPWLATSQFLFKIEQLINPRRRNLAWPRSPVERIFELSSLEQYIHLMGFWPMAMRSALWKKQMPTDLASSFLGESFSFHSDSGAWNPWQAVDAEIYLVDDILRKLDTSSMACSLECRCPLLDHRVAEFAATLPKEFSIDWRKNTKVLLKRLYPDLLPQKIFTREKKGFSLPIDGWMRKQWKDPLRESIEGTSDGGMDSFLDRKVIKRFWQEHQDGIQDHSQRLWAWHVLCRWNDKFKPSW